MQFIYDLSNLAKPMEVNPMWGIGLGNLAVSKRRMIFTQLVIINLLLTLFLMTVLFVAPDVSNASRTRADEVEPNDTFAQATDIADKSFSGNVDQSDSTDYYKVTLTAGQTISVVYVTNATGNTTALGLYDGTEKELWKSAWIAHDSTLYFNYTLNRTLVNPYYLAVMAENTGNFYDITTTITSQNDAKSDSDASDVEYNATDLFSGTNSAYLAKHYNIENSDDHDYYKFELSQGGIFDLNMSVSLAGSATINFEILDNEKNPIKSNIAVKPGEYSLFKYVTNGSFGRMFYLSASIASGSNNYDVLLFVNYQDDAISGKDAGDNFTAAIEFQDDDVPYTGMLGAGKVGNDRIDMYEILLLVTDKTVEVNITIVPDKDLDLTLNVYNNTEGILKTMNPGAGTEVLLKVFTLRIKRIYLELMVDPGKTSLGEYTITINQRELSEGDKDTDSDNMPDSWEGDHGLNPNSAADAEEDKDSDGLTNLREYNIDTDPTSKDTDSDGMPDGWEDEKQLDPLTDDANLDPDNDGYSNLDEFENKTEPLNQSSHPVAAYGHLTSEAVKRSYTDITKDVRYWRGTWDYSKNLGTIQESGIASIYPSYDLVSLDSNRVQKELVVKLKADGKIMALGDYSAGESGQIKLGTYYVVLFIDKAFEELDFTEQSLPNLFTQTSSLIPYTLEFFNDTFTGTPGTVGSKADDQTLQWTIPLGDLTALPADFELYGFVYTFIIGDFDTPTFDLAADTMGTGSIPPAIKHLLGKIDDIAGHKITVSISSFSAGGEILVEEAEKPNEAPEGTGDLGIYVDIELTGGVTPESIFISVEYDDEDIPEGYTEQDIKIFYYNESQNKWLKIPDSGVWANNNTAWARPKHLTVFSPMSKPGEDSNGGPFDMGLLILIIIIIVIVIIIVVSGVVIARSRRKAPPSPPPKRQERALNPEFFTCPRCGEEVEVPLADTQKVGLVCPNCGGKGKIDNPYLGRESGSGSRGRESRHDYDDDYDRDSRRLHAREPEPRQDIDLEYRPPPGRGRGRSSRRSTPEPEEDDYEYKKCPKCRAKIPIPYEDDEKISIKCPDCGAKGTVKNPYI
jgi:DNA-directed RNA polymerase subunit RPC12/RpoP/uncharacterized membrane protein